MGHTERQAKYVTCPWAAEEMYWLMLLAMGLGPVAAVGEPAAQFPLMTLLASSFVRSLSACCPHKPWLALIA